VYLTSEWEPFQPPRLLLWSVLPSKSAALLRVDGPRRLPASPEEHILVLGTHSSFHRLRSLASAPGGAKARPREASVLSRRVLHQLPGPLLRLAVGHRDGVAHDLLVL
jgi:hypothetical protein